MGCRRWLSSCWLLGMFAFREWGSITRLLADDCILLGFVMCRGDANALFLLLQQRITNENQWNDTSQGCDCDTLDTGWMAVSASHEISFDLVNIGISLGYGSLATLDDCCIGLAWKYFLEDATYAEDVVADVSLSGYDLFWRDVARCARRLFENGKVVGI